MTIKVIGNSHMNRGYRIDKRFFSKESFYSAFSFLESVPGIIESPIVRLKELAKDINVNEIMIKDESQRCDLKSFKILGAVFAISKIITNDIGLEISETSFDQIKKICLSKLRLKYTFTTCSDGNHGLAVAWVARELGQKAVIYMNKGTDIQRVSNIEKLGAVVKVTDVNYDDTVRLAKNNADEKKWVLVQDTCIGNNYKTASNIMIGYSKIIYEYYKKDKIADATHIFLQAGVGAMAGGITACLGEVFKDKNPKIIIVEPETAACFFASISNPEGKRVAVKGELDSIMAGLACGEPNEISWNIVRHHVPYFIKCSDDVTVLGMRVYANPVVGDMALTSGESGAVTLGVLYKLMKCSRYENYRRLLNLGKDSKILIISTEGDTAPEKYLKILGE